MFKVGDKVEHILSKDWLIVLEIIKDGLLRCRTKELKEVFLYEWEVIKK
jgi:hypothetical protein